MFKSLQKLFGGSGGGAKTPEQRKAVYLAFQKACKEEHDKSARQTLGGVRVRPGENPYTAGAFALLQGMGSSHAQSRTLAMKRVRAKYRLTEEELLAIEKEGNAAGWER